MLVSVREFELVGGQRLVAVLNSAPVLAFFLFALSSSLLVGVIVVVTAAACYFVAQGLVVSFQYHHAPHPLPLNFPLTLRTCCSFCLRNLMA